MGAWDEVVGGLVVQAKLLGGGWVFSASALGHGLLFSGGGLDALV
jgi:hypothetical protein